MTLSKIPFSLFAPAPTASSQRNPPGRVTQLHGIVIQSDASSFIGKLLIRPAEALDLWFAGMLDRDIDSFRQGHGMTAPLGMHAGLHVSIDDGRHFVIEQLAGGFRDLFVDGLHWTPLGEFEGREREGAGGWNVTIPPHDLRQVDAEAEANAIHRLNHIRGRPFLHEDCTGFVGRVFGAERRIFADSPILRSIGIDIRSGEPAMPLLSRQAALDSESEKRLRADALRDLPDPAAASGTLSLRQLHHRLLVAGAVCAGAALLAAVLLPKRK